MEIVAMSDLELLSSRVERTRRNIVKAGPILASAVALSLATTKIAVAKDKDEDKDKDKDKDKDPKCLLKGTRIQTAEGECKVEDLAIGDLLPTMFGGLRPVLWIGRYPIRKSNPSKPWVKDALPVRIARSALALNVPHADLYVTASHSLLIDGVLVPAEALINGTTITRYEAREYDEM
jgi:hypothetical protein